MPTPADLLGSGAGGVPGFVISTVYSGMRALARGPGGLRLNWRDSTPGQRRFIERTVGRRGYGVDPQGNLYSFSAMATPPGATPPIAGGNYPFPVPRGEVTRGPFRNPWDPYTGLFEILIRTGKRLWKKVPKGAVRKAATRALPGVVGVGIYVGGVLWDFLPDWPEGASNEEIAKRRVAQGCKRHGDGWICPPGRGRPSPGAQPPMRSPPAAPTALPGGSPTEGAPAPVVTSGPIIRTVTPQPRWKKWLEAATPFLPLAALLFPSGGKKQPSVTTNIALPANAQFPSYLTGLNARPASLPGSGTGSKRCECGPKRKRKPKDKRKVCYRGTYTETPTGLLKRRGKRVSCQRSRKRQRS